MSGIALLGGQTSAAQVITPPLPAGDPNVAIATPAEPGNIALPAPADATRGSEQWFTGTDGSRAVRNVTIAMLTPVLPDPAKATGAAVIVAPGGGFMRLEVDAEGFAVARRLADQGIAAFVLKYRLFPVPPESSLLANVLPPAAGGGAGPPYLTTPAPALEDGKAAMRLVRARAAEWHVDPNRVGFMGFSAGAILTVSMALSDDAAVRPDFVLPIYGLLGRRAVPSTVPPMFAAIALDDPITGWSSDLDLFEAWRAVNRPVEAHFYENGGHGFASATEGTTSDLWFNEAIAWMKARGLLRPAGSAPQVYTVEMPIGKLTDNPETMAILAKRLPTLVNGGGFNLVRGLSLRSLQRYAPQTVSAEALAAIERDLAALATKQ